MRAVLLKYIVMLICILAILQKAGISVSVIYKENVVAYTHSQTANDDEDAAKSDGAKEFEIKEYWAIHPHTIFLHVCGIEMQVIYTDHHLHNHLAWIPPVPTPPPDLQV